MISVKIAELRSKLSDYLKKVRSGLEVTIVDRDLPIGRIVPLKSRATRAPWDMLPPRSEARRFAKFQGPVVACAIDPVALLLEDRARR